MTSCDWISGFKFSSARELTPSKTSRKMSAPIDTEQGREMIARGFAIAEPVFGNIRPNKRLNRFTLRGRQKVDGQWKLCCLVHNIEKLAHNGYAR